MASEFSSAELIFAKRMLPHFMAGKSPAEAAKAVLDDDTRLLVSLCDRSHSYFIDIGDGASGRTRQGAGDLIASQISAKVYSRLRLAAEPAQ